MSESGKVSLPTPERIEEIRRLHAAASPGPWTYDETVGDVHSEKTDEIICSDVHNAPFIAASISIVPELLAALEESQQRIGKLELYIKSLEFSRDEAQKMAHAISKEQGLELFEAQQTIARQQERERSIIYEVSEIHKEASAGNSGSLERADTALNRIMLLSSNLLALGNKEGER